MASRRSGVHSLLNFAETNPGHGLGSESEASTSSSADWYISAASRSPSNSRIASSSPKRLQTPPSMQPEAFKRIALDTSSPMPDGHHDTFRGQFTPSGLSHQPTPAALHHAYQLPPVSHDGRARRHSALPYSQPTFDSFEPDSGSRAAPHTLPSIGETHLRGRLESPSTPPTLPALNQSVGEKLLLSIDTYSASKEAGGKRQKNADASARYRRRKADMAAEEKSKLAQLQEENRYLGGRVIELTRQKEFYRSERRALRELMLGVPGLDGAARNRPATPRPPFEG